jgi:hypothetical protein
MPRGRRLGGRTGTARASGARGTFRAAGGRRSVRRAVRVGCHDAGRGCGKVMERMPVHRTRRGAQQIAARLRLKHHPAAGLPSRSGEVLAPGAGWSDGCPARISPGEPASRTVASGCGGCHRRARAARGCRCSSPAGQALPGRHNLCRCGVRIGHRACGRRRLGADRLCGGNPLAAAGVHRHRAAQLRHPGAAALAIKGLPSFPAAWFPGAAASILAGLTAGAYLASVPAVTAQGKRPSSWQGWRRWRPS